MTNSKRNTIMSITCGLALVATLERGADAGTIVVFGDHAARADAQDRLVEAGHEVVIAGALPLDLSSYDAVWHVGAATQFDDNVRNRLGEFMKNGGGVFLSGEWSCCETMNASIQQVVNRFVRSSASAPSSIVIGGLGSAASGTHYFNPDAVGEAANAPNVLEAWRPGTTGKIDGVAGDNILTLDGEGSVTGAIWGASDLRVGGQLIVMMDSDWYNRPGAGEIAANLAQFLIEGVAQPEDPRDWTKPTVDSRTGAASDEVGFVVVGREITEDGSDDEISDEDLAVGCSAGGGASGGLGLGMLGILGALAFVNRKKRG